MPLRPPSPRITDLNRRRFLRDAGLLGGCVAAGLLDGCAELSPPEKSPEPDIVLVSDPLDPVAASPAVQWAASVFVRGLGERGVPVRRAIRPADAASDELCVVAAGSGSPLAVQLLKQAGIESPTQRESLSICSAHAGGRTIVLACAADSRGLAYALTELNDRAIHSSRPRQALQSVTATVERPANRIRSVMRCFASDVEDKPWFNDRAFWESYLTALAAQRFNRFHLALGLGYDGPTDLRDTYFFFAYPFLLDVPGFSVRATELPSDERDANLRMLKFISNQAAARGMEFQLGLWTHAYQWIRSPGANYHIQGLTPATHAAYCQAALRMLLAECPAITGISLRIHGESGVPEGSYDFWQSLFSAVGAAGRPVNLDLHAKGIDQRMIDLALATGQAVTVAPKFWAEHTGLPYLQSSIRRQEMPKARPDSGFFALSTGARSFLRYSYGDLFRTGRRYGILHRVWPGTQRLLLSGDPESAAGYGRIFNLLGADGVEIFDPLSFKGRKGSGLKADRPGDRGCYLDPALRPAGGDWEKYLYAYRLWGRLTYNPASDPDVWQRRLNRHFGAAGPAMGSALATSSRILPLITSAHDPSGANANYWPELYTNMPIARPGPARPYSDTPSPKIFGTVSSLDPQIFADSNECADALLAGESIPRYTPLEVADKLDKWAGGCLSDLDSARRAIAGNTDSDYRRWTIDAAIAAGLGQFFAWKFRAAVLHAIFDRTGDGNAHAQSLRAYRLARGAWAELAAQAVVYVNDITFGPDPWLRGHWRDRLAEIDADIAELDAIVVPIVTKTSGAAAIAAALSPAPRPLIAALHHPPAAFTPGQAIPLEIRSPGATSVRLCYRHVNQAEEYESSDMRRRADAFAATIPGDYTNSPFALQYYFEIRSDQGICLSPGLGKDFLGQPYWLLPQG